MDGSFRIIRQLYLFNDGENRFQEYVETGFQKKYQELYLEEWVENNPDNIVEDGKLLIVGRQVVINLGGYIDLLAIDRQGALVIIELKRDRTPRETIAQALEYASFVESLDYDLIEGIYCAYTGDENAILARDHQSYFDLTSDEVVTLNKEQRIVIIGQRISPEIRQTASFLRMKGIRTTCVEFSFFKSSEGRRLFSTEIVVGMETPMKPRVSSEPLVKTTEPKFMQALDDFGVPVFLKLFEWVKEKSYVVRWGTKGFSVNVLLGENTIPFGYGYIPACIFKQSIMTGFYSNHGILRKSNPTEEYFADLIDEGHNMSVLQSAGKGDFKWVIDRAYTDEQIETVFERFDRIVEKLVQNYLE